MPYVGGTNGNHSYDTDRFDNNIKSLYSLYRKEISGTGGDDFMCGHCGYVILEDFDPSTVNGNPVYQCRVCENNNDLRSP